MLTISTTISVSISWTSNLLYLSSYMKKKGIRTFFDTIHKSKLKMEEQFGMQPVLRSLSSKRERDLVPPLKPEQDYFTSFPNTGMKRTSQSDKRVNSPRKHDSS